MASGTSGRQAEVGSTGILDANCRAFLGGKAGSIVTFFAGHASVFAFEQVSRFLVIESFDVPLDQREILTVVLRVTAGAFLAGAGRDVKGGVEASASCEPGRDFGVTVQTLQRRLAPELVATGTVRGAVQRLMWSREWPGRDLGRSGCQKQHENPK